jgi:hyperosmotically inducible protein
LLASLAACTRTSESAPAPPAGAAGSRVGDDLKGVAKETQKTAKDIGHAATDFADKAGKGIQDVANQAGEKGGEAWLTTKVKSELSTAGFDPLHVHVDTDGQVVTLSGTVDSAAAKGKAVDVARSVKGVTSVQDHLFVKPAQR